MNASQLEHLPPSMLAYMLVALLSVLTITAGMLLFFIRREIARMDRAALEAAQAAKALDKAVDALRAEQAANLSKYVTVQAFGDSSVRIYERINGMDKDHHTRITVLERTAGLVRPSKE